MTGWDELRYVLFAGDDSSDGVLAQAEDMWALLNKINIKSPEDVNKLHSLEDKEEDQFGTKGANGLSEVEKSIEGLKNDLTGLS